MVIGAMTEFSKPHYKVDVLKVEVPVNAEYVEGSSVYKGMKAYSREEALHLYRKGRGGGQRSRFIYLEARGSATRSSSSRLQYGFGIGHGLLGHVLCGRATWKEGRYADLRKEGRCIALEDWLATEGVKNIEAVNDAIKSAKPWSHLEIYRPRRSSGRSYRPRLALTRWRELFLVYWRAEALPTQRDASGDLPCALGIRACVRTSKRSASRSIPRRRTGISTTRCTEPMAASTCRADRKFPATISPRTPRLRGAPDRICGSHRRAGNGRFRLAPDLLCSRS